MMFFLIILQKDLQSTAIYDILILLHKLNIYGNHPFLSLGTIMPVPYHNYRYRQIHRFHFVVWLIPIFISLCSDNRSLRFALR